MSQPHAPTTAQEIFNTVALHLITQGRPAGTETMCYYRTTDGLRCAVGILIPDSKYTPQIEELSVDALAERGWLPSNLLPHLYLLRQLQDAHDELVHHPKEDYQLILAKNLQKVAAEFNLNPQVLMIA